ncbi:MAG: RHS repeat-associated core domain-containing protein [Clostridia bacterium]|nr:RHS repeat-associated core domain-containing protein [Clostridia bacterium]
MTKKVITFADNSTHTVYYENSDDNTVVKFDVPDPEDANKKQTITSHSKTDSFGRKTFDELQLGTGYVSRQFSYCGGQITATHKQNNIAKSEPTTQLVKRITLTGDRTLDYEYDAEERITKVTDSVDGVTEYTYDALGQLKTETKEGKTTKFEYDNYGNITAKAKGVVDENGNFVEESKITYEYGNEGWRDLLTSYNGQSITYDAQGNPTSYLGHALTWEKGRQLKKFDNIEYTYNANGIRTSKKVNGVLHTYTLDGTKILRETWDGNTLLPLYDNEDGVCGILYNNVPYYFIKNLQGDVIAIVNKDAQTVARYSYDAWGVCTVTQDSVGIANINPFRYRGYYYDEDIGLYYLQSRYYDASVGRFSNADDTLYVIWSNSILNQNLVSFAENTGIMNNEYNGALSIPRSMVAFILDIVFMSIPVIGAAFAPIKSIAKAYGKAALKTKARTPLATLIRKIAEFAKNIIEGLVKAVKKIPFVGSSWAKKIPVNKLTTMIAGGTSSLIINQALNVLLANVDLILSLGGVISGFVDWIVDKKLDGKIRI